MISAGNRLIMRISLGMFVLMSSFPLLVAPPGLGQGSSAPAAVSAPPGPIYYLAVKASINPITKDYIVRHIAQAEREGASLVVLQLDTPGGLVSSTKEIVDAMLNAKVPVVVWVGPAGAWAASAGTFITMAAHVAVMARGATIGAAHPVNIGGSAPGSPNEESPQPQEKDNQGNPPQEKSGGDAVAEKITNFTAEWAREIAKVRGRDPDWAEQAVRSSVTAGWEEALERRIIDLVADSRGELLQELNGYTLSDGRALVTEGAALVEMPMSWRERMLNYLADPNLVYLLLTIGLLALTYEFLSPTIGLGFIVGGISLLLAFMGLQILPVNLVGLALILFGVLLMVLDAFTPTHGILTTGGVVSLLAGSFTLFEIPDPALQLSMWNILVTVGSITALFVFVIGKGLLAQKRVPVTGIEGMVGAVGVAKEPLRSAGRGRVLVHGEYWWAEPADEQLISPGEEVVVERVEGGKLIVRRRA
jgi:membrane-bound serine protease (ClpP class)